MKRTNSGERERHREREMEREEDRNRERERKRIEQQDDKSAMHQSDKSDRITSSCLMTAFLKSGFIFMP